MIILVAVIVGITFFGKGQKQIRKRVRGGSCESVRDYCLGSTTLFSRESRILALACARNLACNARYASVTDCLQQCASQRSRILLGCKFRVQYAHVIKVVGVSCTRYDFVGPEIIAETDCRWAKEATRQ